MLIAIYSRKSKWSEKGESTENQIVLCKDYITHVMKPEGTPEIRIYEDEGFSGKNSNRPAFVRMLEDMERWKFDCLICYKLDRLGRNLSDLTRLMDRLEKQRISFISVKERFDTTTPIGKAMLYFSGVLAQMEREQIAERVRDNMFLLARSGRWLGGNTPYGFVSETVRYETIKEKTKRYSILKENEEESAVVEEIFRRYLLTGSLCRTAEFLKKEGIKTRQGNDFSVSAVKDILRNPVYCCQEETSLAFFKARGCQIFPGQTQFSATAKEGGNRRDRAEACGWMAYGKTTSLPNKNTPAEYEQWILAPGSHRGIIEAGDFIKVQRLLDGNCRKGPNFKRDRNTQAWLSGVLFCSCGSPMRPKYYGSVGKEGKKPYVYLCTGKERSRGEICRQKNLPGKKAEEAVFEALFPTDFFYGTVNGNGGSQQEDCENWENQSNQEKRENHKNQLRHLYEAELKLQWTELLPLFSRHRKECRKKKETTCRAEEEWDNERTVEEKKRKEKTAEYEKQMKRLMEILKNESLTDIVKTKILKEIEDISIRMECLEQKNQIGISGEAPERLCDIKTLFLQTDTSWKRQYLKELAGKITCAGEWLDIELNQKITDDTLLAQ